VLAPSPSLSTTRFTLPFLILTLVVHPSSPAYDANPLSAQIPAREGTPRIPSAAVQGLRRTVCPQTALHHQLVPGGSAAHASQGHTLRWKWVVVSTVSWVSGDFFASHSLLIFSVVGMRNLWDALLLFRCERFCSAGISLRVRGVVLRGGREGRASRSRVCLWMLGPSD
jgi:hypothetical protein